MPIYEYQCVGCGHEFEMIQKMTDTPVKQCPKCFKESAQKLVSAPGFQLKGTGWYETDFKNKPKQTADKNAAKSKNKEPVKSKDTSGSNQQSTSKETSS